MEIELEEFKNIVNTYFIELGKQPLDEFCRDTIIPRFWQQFEGLMPPIVVNPSEAEAEELKRYFAPDPYVGQFRSPVAEILDRDALKVITSFPAFVKSLGYNEYFMYSECFWNRKLDDEMTKVFKLSVGYDVSRFIKEEQLNLMYRDTILITPDMKRILILFHHDYYEIYDKETAQEFISFIKNKV